MAESCKHTHIRLISKEGHTFVVDLAAACVSKTIGHMLDSGAGPRTVLHTASLTLAALCRLHGGAGGGNTLPGRAWRERCPSSLFAADSTSARCR